MANNGVFYWLMKDGGGLDLSLDDVCFEGYAARRKKTVCKHATLEQWRQCPGNRSCNSFDHIMISKYGAFITMWKDR